MLFASIACEFEVNAWAGVLLHLWLITLNQMLTSQTLDYFFIPFFFILYYFFSSTKKCADPNKSSIFFIMGQLVSMF